MKTYSINISLKGRHWARVELSPTSTHEAEAKCKAREVAARFPASEGFAVTLSSTPVKISTEVDFAEGAIA